MRSGITIANGAIPAARQYSSFVHQHRADRHFTASARFACLRQCLPHKFNISVHFVENNMDARVALTIASRRKTLPLASRSRYLSQGINRKSFVRQRLKERYTFACL